MIEEVGRDPRFAKDAAEGTGYVPKGLIAVPLLPARGRSGRSRCSTARRRFGLEEMELLELFAEQAAIGLDLLQRAREAEAALGGGGRLAVVARVRSRGRARRSGRRGGHAVVAAALEEVLR